MNTANTSLPTRNGKVEQAIDRFLSLVDDSGTKLGNAIAHGVQAIGLKKLAQWFESHRKSANSSVAIPASWASAGVGYWHPTHGTSCDSVRSSAGRCPARQRAHGECLMPRSAGPAGGRP